MESNRYVRVKRGVYVKANGRSDQEVIDAFIRKYPRQSDGCSITTADSFTIKESETKIILKAKEDKWKL